MRMALQAEETQLEKDRKAAKVRNAAKAASKKAAPPPPPAKRS